MNHGKGKIEVDDSEKQPRLTIFFLSCYPKGSFLEAIGEAKTKLRAYFIYEEPEL